MGQQTAVGSRPVRRSWKPETLSVAGVCTLRKAPGILFYNVITMQGSIAGHNPYNLFIFKLVKSKNFTTSLLQTTENLAMVVVKYIHIQISGQVMNLSIGGVVFILMSNLTYT